MFAFYLGDEADGELVIGGYDEARMRGDVNWVNLARPGYWLIAIESVKFGDAVITANDTGGSMDTGTSIIYGPPGQVRAMVASIEGAQFNTQEGLYSIPCDTRLPSLEFGIGGRGYRVPGEDLVLRDGSGFFCFFGVAIMGMRVGAGDGPVPFQYVGNTWVVGDTFLRQYYTIYDYDNERFGLADLNNSGKYETDLRVENEVVS
jgi:hypothetical protein